MSASGDPAETIFAFIATCCETNARFSESVRALGHAWQRWLLLHRAPTATRRQHGERWLLAHLTDPAFDSGSFTRVERNGRVFVKGLALREGRFALTLPDPAHTTVALLASAVSLPPAAQAHIPLTGATANKRPPSAEILRRFLDSCCAISTSDADGQQPGESRFAYRHRLLSESLTRLGLALRAWLTQEGARPSLLRLCSAQWLRRELAHRGHSCWVGAEGSAVVSGVSLLPAWQGFGRQHRVRRGDSGRTSLVRHTEDTLDAPHVFRHRASRRTLLPPGATSTTKEVPLEDALRQYAATYVESVLVRDPSGELRFTDLVSGFRAFLLNRHVVLRGRSPLADALRIALGGTGTRLSGWRFGLPTE